ncbi:MAG: hypothetical protein NTV57_15965 [Cyanobacteria bacterium]|nr:hypothetical protein [Cyanobacteriota bacterium]
MIAGETPYFDSIYDNNGEGEYVLPKKMIKSILAAKRLANVSTRVLFPCHGARLVVSSWLEIDGSLDNYLRGDLEGKMEWVDRFDSKMLLEIKKPYLSEESK